MVYKILKREKNKIKQNKLWKKGINEDSRKCAFNFFLENILSSFQSNWL